MRLTLTEFVDSLADHHLVGLDATTELCSCGDRRGRILDHYAELIWAAFPPTFADKQRQQRGDYYRLIYYPRIKARTEPNLEDLARARRVLAARQAENERLGRIVDALNLPFLDRLDWLIAHDPGWHHRHGWPEHPFPESKELTA